MKKLIFVLSIGVILLLSIYFSIDSSAASVSYGEYQRLELPTVDYLNYDEFFAAQGAFGTSYSLPDISDNLAKVVGFHAQDRCSVQVNPGYTIFYSVNQDASVILDFAELPPGTYTFRYTKLAMGGTSYCSFYWRSNEGQAWNTDPGSWDRPIVFTVKEGDRFQVKLYNWNGKTHYYRMWFYITPFGIDTSGMSPTDVQVEPYYNQIGKVYHVGREYYQVVDENFAEYYNDYSALKDLGECIITPDIDYTNYKLYKTFNDKWRILWRTSDVHENPLIYENGLFYVEDTAYCYYSKDVYDTFCDALVALTSKDTQYTFDVIRKYEHVLNDDAVSFFDPQYSEIFWNVYVEDVFDATFYSRFNPEHFAELTYAYGDQDDNHWSIPAVFSFQNYSEEYVAMPIELISMYSRSAFTDIGSFIIGGANSFFGYVSTTATKIYSAAEDRVTTVTGYVRNGVTYAIKEIRSYWKHIENGAEDFVSDVVTESNEVITDIKDMVHEVVPDNFAESWLNDLRDMFTVDKQPFRDIMGLFKDKFYFITDLRGIVESFLQLFSSTYSTRSSPPVIYADFAESESQYFQGIGQVAVVDFSWYARYKPYVDTFLSAVIWGFFLFQLYLRLPDIISGVGSGLGSLGGWAKGSISAKESKSRRK